MKNLKTLALAAFAMLSIVSCKDNEPQCKDVKWSYSGEGAAANWADLCDVGGVNECGFQAQSPVNLTGAQNNSALKPIELDYKVSSGKFFNTGHGIKFDVKDAGNTAMIQGEKYKLLQFHFHGKSEHTINGDYSPLEVHFVHQIATGEAKYAVIGAMINEGAESPFLTKYLSQFKGESDTTQTSFEDLNVTELLPSVNVYYNYQGSLTTPPCSEVVNWHVLKANLTASKGQIETFSKLLNGNYRPIQELNGRTISIFNGN